MSLILKRIMLVLACVGGLCLGTGQTAAHPGEQGLYSAFYVSGLGQGGAVHQIQARQDLIYATWGHQADNVLRNRSAQMIGATTVNDSVSTVIRVDDANELKSALNAATGGETIELAPGVQFGHLDIRWKDYASDVTIRTAEGGDQARFWSAAIIDSANIVIENVTFKYSFKPEHATFFAPFSVAGSSGITFRDMHFDGSDAIGVGGGAEGMPSGMGLRARASSDITVENSLINTFWTAIHFEGVEGVVIRGNEITDIRSDGINVPKTKNVLIEDNHIHNFRGLSDWSDHRDMIQFWGTDGYTTQNLTIRGNVLDIGEGSYAQSIFAGTPKYDPANPVHMFRDITIEDNLIVNSHFHGISLGVTDGLVVRNNTLIQKITEHVPPHSGNVPLINLDSRSNDVELTDNVTPLKIYEGDGSWTTGGNVIVHPLNYNATFTGLDGPAMEMGLVPGGVLDQLGAGSSHLSAPAPLPEDDAHLTGGGGDEFVFIPDDKVTETPPVPNALLLAGQTTFEQLSADAWITVSFGTVIENARVVVGPATFNGSDPGDIRVRNVTETGFEMQFDEWDYLDGYHVAETVSWIAASEGRWRLESGEVIELGRVQLADETPENITFTGDMGSDAAVFAQVTSHNGWQAVTDRINAVTGTGFEVRMQEEEANDGRHMTETLDWLAVSGGDQLRVGRGEVNHDAAAISLAVDAQTAVLGDVQTLWGKDPVTLRKHGAEFGAVTVALQEETSADAETWHMLEQVALLALDLGSHDLFLV